MGERGRGRERSEEMRKLVVPSVKGGREGGEQGGREENREGEEGRRMKSLGIMQEYMYITTTRVQLCSCPQNLRLPSEGCNPLVREVAMLLNELARTEVVGAGARW